MNPAALDSLIMEHAQYARKAATSWMVKTGRWGFQNREDIQGQALLILCMEARRYMGLNPAPGYSFKCAVYHRVQWGLTDWAEKEWRIYGKRADMPPDVADPNSLGFALWTQIKERASQDVISWLNGATLDEIAKAHRVKRRTAYMRVRRGLNRIKESLQ